jgi:hypothetical protein
MSVRKRAVLSHFVSVTPLEIIRPPLTHPLPLPTGRQGERVGVRGMPSGGIRHSALINSQRGEAR